MVGRAEYPRLLELPEQSFFLFGVRGVGKSTWALSNLPDARRLDLLDESLYHDLLADPSLFGSLLEPLPRSSWVIVDEVQRIPAVLNEVHRFIESRDLRFALLGSSARKLKQAGTNLLAGRALRKQMFPLTPEELGNDFSLESALRFGSIPVVVTSSDPRATLESYVQMYIREEIRAEALVRNLPGFLRFLPIAALFHGQMVNVSGIARDAGTARTTVEGYLEILEDTLLTFRLTAFEAKLRVRERKHPKLYWTDPGLVRATRQRLGEVHHEERGALLEGWILGLLRTYRENSRIYDEIHYWAPAEGKTEVDFLLRSGDRFLAIEVKSSTRFDPSMLTGLHAIAPLPGLTLRILVYGGTRARSTSDGIEVWPISRFLEALREGNLWGR
jgi:uncharacterized protein